jgi:hypothetical protein
MNEDTDENAEGRRGVSSLPNAVPTIELVASSAVWQIDLRLLPCTSPTFLLPPCVCLLPPCGTSSCRPPSALSLAARTSARRRLRQTRSAETPAVSGLVRVVLRMHGDGKVGEKAGFVDDEAGNRRADERTDVADEDDAVGSLCRDRQRQETDQLSSKGGCGGF